MFTGPSAHVLAVAAAPLLSSFGGGLTLWRDDNVVHWCYEGQTAVVALAFDGTVEATFVDRPQREEISGGNVQAQYRSGGGRPYRLNASGAAAMIADMMAFFSGTREPQFRFTGLL